MKLWLKGVLLLAAVAAVLTACSPFVFSTNSLKGKTVTYYTDLLSNVMGYNTDNGHNTTVLAFDSSGAAGTFEIQDFNYQYADQTSATTGSYSGMTWVHVSGEKGTFTYDAKTQVMVATFTDFYTSKTGASNMTGCPYPAAADYTYLDPATFQSNSSGQTVTAYSLSFTVSVDLTQDNAEVVYSAGSTADTWVSTQIQKTSETVGGVTTTDEITYTGTYTITSSSIVDENTNVDVNQVGSAAAVTTTHEYKYNSSVDKFFLVGADTGTKTFTDVWKKNNTVTFQTEETGYTEISYTGSTPPGVPTVNTTTGIGLTGTKGTPPYYYIDNNLNANTPPSGNELSFTNMSDYILFSGDLSSAVRHLAK